MFRSFLRGDASRGGHVFLTAVTLSECLSNVSYVTKSRDNCQIVLENCKNLVLESFLAIFDRKRVSEMYDSYFDSSHVTV